MIQMDYTAGNKEIKSNQFSFKKMQQYQDTSPIKPVQIEGGLTTAKEWLQPIPEAASNRYGEKPDGQELNSVEAFLINKQDNFIQNLIKLEEKPTD